MAKKNVRVEIPVNSPDAMLKLAESITEKHKELGTNSPLGVFNMGEFEKARQNAASKVKEARNLHAKAEAATQESYNSLGFGKGQTSETKGTAYNMVTRFRDQLLLTHDGNEEKLSEWGFNVVVSSGTINGGSEPVSESAAKTNGVK